MGLRERPAAEQAFENLIADEMALACLDDFALIDRVAVLAGFAPPGYTGYAPIQVAVSELLREADAALPSAASERLRESTERTKTALQPGGEVPCHVESIEDSPSGEASDPLTHAMPTFRRAAAGHLCEVLVPALLEGHRNRTATVSDRSACLRAACGVLWVLKTQHYAYTQAPLVAQSFIERLDLDGRDEHVPLRDAVVRGCDAKTLLRLLPQPQGKAGSWRFSSDYSSCAWGNDMFHFPKEPQRAVIRMLWKEYESTGMGLATRTIRSRLEELGVEFPDSIDPGRTVSHLFKRHPCMGSMLTSPEGLKGRQYMLAPPEVP